MDLAFCCISDIGLLPHTLVSVTIAAVVPSPGTCSELISSWPPAGSPFSCVTCCGLGGLCSLGRLQCPEEPLWVSMGTL